MYFFPTYMQYLAYFKPNKELSDLILSQKDIVVHGSGLHCTLCFFPMESKYERSLISDLSNITFNSFEIKTQGLDNFDKGSLVLKLSRPDELIHLHKEIVSTVRKYASPKFDEIAKKYYGDNYIPHLTISESSHFNKKLKYLSGRVDIISRYNLVKKSNGKWKEIQTFYSKKKE
jgi:hypothetical protein